MVLGRGNSFPLPWPETHKTRPLGNEKGIFLRNSSNLDFGNSKKRKKEMSTITGTLEIQGIDWKRLCRIGGVAALLQLACGLVTMVVVFALGGEPATAQEYFDLLQADRLAGLLRMDFASVLTVGLYPLTAFGLYSALRRDHPAFMTLALALVVTGAVLWLGSHSAFSMISLADRYAAAGTEAGRSQLLAAGQAVIASDMWHSTGAFMSGIFLQGATTLISFLMLRGRVFGKATAWVGLLGHGLDLAHVLLMVIVPAIGPWLMIVAGPLYPVWFFLVGRRLLQLSRAS